MSVYSDTEKPTCLCYFFHTERRYHVAKEILETEKKYLSCLRTLKEVRFERLLNGSQIDMNFDLRRACTQVFGIYCFQ